MPIRTVRCIIEGCPITNRQTQIKLFVFPRNKEQCEKWVEFSKSPRVHNRWNAGKTMNKHNMRICALHFKDEDFANCLHDRLLREKVPSVFKPDNISEVILPNNGSVEVSYNVSPSSCRQEITSCVTTSSSNEVFRSIDSLQIVSPSSFVKSYEIVTSSYSSDTNESETITSLPNPNKAKAVVYFPDCVEKMVQTSSCLPSSSLSSAPSTSKHCPENLHNSVDINSSTHNSPSSDHSASELDKFSATDDSYQKLSSSSEDEAINLFDKNRKRELYNAHRKSLAKLFKKKKNRMPENLRKICKILKQKWNGIFGIEQTDPSLVILASQTPQAAEIMKLIFECSKMKSAKKMCFSSLYNSVSFSIGINSQLLAVISHSLESLKDSNRICALLFDEMPIKQYYHYDKSLDVLIGLEDHGKLGRIRRTATSALVFMISALSGQWKQPIATYFIGKSTKPEHIAALITLVLEKCFESNLKVVATVCNIHFNKVRALKILGSTIEKPFFIFNENKIVTLHDPTHILLSTRDFFMHHDVLVSVKTLGLEAKGRAKWEHLISAYVVDQDLDKFRILHRLKDHHFQRRTSVKLAAQILSYSVASFLMNGVHLKYLPSGAVSTAYFVKLVDSLFDSMNGCKNKRIDDKLLRRCITANSNHFVFWKETVKEVENWKFFSNCGTFYEKEFLPRPPCQSAWLVNLRGMQILCANLMEGKKPLIDTLAARCLHLHPLWKLFGSVRLYCGSKGDPTGVQFINGMKAHMLKRVFSKNTLPASKYLSDSSWFLKNMQTICKNDEDIGRNGKVTFGDFAVSDIFCDVSVTSTATLCWFITRRILHTNTCNNCRRALCGTEADAELLIVVHRGHDLEEANCPSRYLIKTLTFGITLAEQAIRCSSLQAGVYNDVVSLLKKNLSFSWLEKCCRVHFEDVSEEILSSLVSTCILWWCNKMNKHLALKRLHPYLIRSQEIPT